MASLPLSGFVSTTLVGVLGPKAWAALLVRGVTNDRMVIAGDVADRFISVGVAGRTIRILLLVSISPSLMPLSFWCRRSEEVDDE